MKKRRGIKLRFIPIFMVFCLYTGGFCQDNSLLSLNLKDIDLKDALKIISQASGMNIITDKDVNATITATLKDLTWQNALDNILKTNELTYRIEGNTIRVMTLSTVKKEEETVPLSTRIITLNFAKAESLKTSLNKILSSRGSMEVNVPTNSLIINDTPEILVKVEKLANQLDIRTPQVMIKALIMSIKLTDTDNFGIDWTATHKKHHLAEEGIRKIEQDLDLTTSALSLSYGKSILPSWSFDATVEFYAENKKASILANPHLLTLNNLEAQIELTEQVPYTSVSQSTDGGTTTSTQFKDVGIKLYVTPQITKDKFISLSVKVEQSYLAAYVGSTNEPQIDSRRTETNFMLRDGETAVIGGLRKKDDTTTLIKVPLLGDIPFLGRFFRKQVKEVVNTELLVFITPDIVEESMSKDYEKKLERSKNELFAGKEERDKVISRALIEQRQKEKQQEVARQREEKEHQAELKRQQREQEGIKEEIDRQKETAKEQEEEQQQETDLKQARQAQAELTRQQRELKRIKEEIEKQIQDELRKKELGLRSQITSLYREAITHYKNNQFEEAIRLFREILSLDPGQTKAKKYLEIYIPKRIEKLK